MKLVDPTDFEILEALSDDRRNNAINIAVLLDRNRSYINTRLPLLASFGLVERVGPAPNSGLYQITSHGQAALANRELHGRDDVDFRSVVEEAVTAESDATPSHSGQTNSSAADQDSNRR